MPLHQPKNLRRVNPRCCLTCLHRENDSDGDPVCIRDNQPRCDEPEYTVCDGWKSRLITPFNDVPNAPELSRATLAQDKTDAA